jgi:hypothetical protein
MRPVAIDGEVWQVNLVSPGNPLLVDRTGRLRLATTDPETRSISISAQLLPPMLDRVLLHEMAHAITISHNLLPIIRYEIPDEYWVLVEEWSAELLEKHSMEAIALASESLGRPLCIMGHCTMVY